MVIVTGTYRDDLWIGHTILTNGGAFLAKIDRKGQVLWARRDGDRLTEGLSVGTDSSGNVYVIVDLKGISSATIGGVTVTGRLALAKFTPNGAPVWARAVANGSSIFAVSTMAVAADGTTYWPVFFSGSASFGSTNLYLAQPGGAFVKCDPEGGVLWVQSPPAGPFTWLADPVLDPSGNLLMCGRFSGSIDLGATNMTSQGGSDIIVTKWSPSGVLLWARQAGGTNDDWSTRLDVDASGNCIVSGSVITPARFNNLSVNSDSGTNYAFLAKYNPQGEALWVQTPIAGHSRMAVAVDSDLNCYFAGDNLTNVIYAKYNAAGELQWSRTVPQSLRLFALRADGMGHCYLYANYHMPIVEFDGITLTRSNSNDNPLVAKLDTTTLPRLIINPTENSVDVSWSVLADNFYLETTTEPGSPESWSSNSALPVVSGTRNVLTSPKTADRIYYRLKRP